MTQENTVVLRARGIQITRSRQGNDRPFQLGPIDLDIRRGEVLAIVGASGCGKSTFLRLLLAQERPTRGEVRIADAPPATEPGLDRGVVFQKYSVFPHMTVRENMSFALKIAKMPKAEIDQAVDRAAKILQLEPFLDRLPKALSGGQPAYTRWG